MKKKRKSTLSAKQLNAQIVTWRKEDRETYKQILMYAEQQGVLLKNKTISMSQKNLKKVQAFAEQYKSQFGSYTSYMKKKNKKYQDKIHKYTEKEYQLDYDKLSLKQKREIKQKLANEGYIQPTLKKQIETDKEYSNLIDKLFENFPSTQAYEEYRYTLDIPQDVAIKRLQEEIEKNKIMPPIEEYLNENKNYDTPFD